jgi:hypothetical protein
MQIDAIADRFSLGLPTFENAREMRVRDEDLSASCELISDSSGRPPRGRRHILAGMSFAYTI